MNSPRIWPVLATLLLTAAGAAHGQLSTPLDSVTLDAFRWRSIGPASMGGRVTDIEGIPSPSKTFFVAAAAGGIWQTTNADVTRFSVSSAAQPDNTGNMVHLAMLYAGLGQPNRAQEMAFAAQSVYDAGSPGGAHDFFELGIAFLLMGEFDRAADYLWSAAEQNPAWASPALLWVDPLWDPLRSHPRFQSLLAEREN